jgi:four helix bundle protein
MRDPSKLRIVATAEELAIATYGVTAKFPREERYGLTAQLRRAAVSVGSNVVEGCHRQRNGAFAPFLHNALGSVAEMQFQLRVATRLGFGDQANVEELCERAEHVRAMLIRLILALRARGD